VVFSFVQAQVSLKDMTWGFKYQSKRSPAGESYNTYNGLYNHYNTTAVGNGFNFSLKAFSKPEATPLQYCSTLRHTFDSSAYGDPYGATSWHSFDRPTVFIDGHARGLKNIQYRSKVSGAPSAGAATITTGSQSNFQVATPASNLYRKGSFDFWLEEY
jgi:hypothetical protein